MSSWDEYVNLRRFMANLEAQTILQGIKTRARATDSNAPFINPDVLCAQCSFSKFTSIGYCGLGWQGCDVIQHLKAKNGGVTTWNPVRQTTYWKDTLPVSKPRQ